MKIAIGCDEAGFLLKNKILKFLKEKEHKVKDFGVYNIEPILYPDMAFSVANAVAKKEYDRGILICGTGIGMAIAANKVKGIRAATCHDSFSIERSIKSNNAQILTMGARIIAPEFALKLISSWLEYEFDGGNSAIKLAQIEKYENENH